MALMSRLLAILLCFSLLIGFVQTPFFHLHEDSQSDHVQRFHRSLNQSFHTHLGSLAGSPWLTDGGEFYVLQEHDHAKFVSWFQANREGQWFPPAHLLQVHTLALPQPSFCETPTSPPRAHSPPSVILTAPRSPPLILSL